MSDQRPDTYQADDEIEIDLRQLFTVLKKWSKLIITMTLLCTLAAGIISYFVLPPVYQASTLLMVTEATDKLQTVRTQQSGLDDVVDSVSRMPVLTMNTYLGQLKSEALMKRIIEKLDLQVSPGGLSSMITATIVKDSNLIEVKVSNQDPELASTIANTLSVEYLQLMTDKNQEQMSRSVTFLDEQKALTDQELFEAEEQLKYFQSQPRGVAVLEAEFDKKSEDVVNYESRLRMVEVEIQQTSAGVVQMQQELSLIPDRVSVTTWNDSGSIPNASQEINPLYVSTAQSLAEKKATLAEKVGEGEGLQALTTAIGTELDGLQAELAIKRVEQEKLQRQVDRLRQTSETLAQKGTETKIAKSIDLGDTSVLVVSEASIPGKPIKPNKKLNIAIAMVLGLMIFILLAFVLEYMDNTLKTPEDITKEMDLPVLGMIPKITKKYVQHTSYGG